MTCFILEHRDLFSLFDKQGDGKVECSEVGDMLRALGCNPTQADVKKIIADIDPTGMYIIQSCNVFILLCS